MKSVTLLFLLLPFFTAAQQAPSPYSGVRDSTQRSTPANGKVYGILRDSLSKDFLEFASVALISIKDSSATGGSLTDSKGHFSIDNVAPGRYKLRITSIGYKTFDTQMFMVSPNDNQKDFGTVLLPPSTRNLKEVTVAGEKEEYINTLDKKIYNADKNLLSTGGSVSDVLQNVPSVTVDIDGKVSLRGSENVTILIDGKPSGLTGDNRAQILRQLPASSIDQIEVITNPGARYDAEGMSGIINITTKKEKRQGINGTASAGIGTHNKYNASLNLNSRSKLFNVYGNYGFRHDERDFEGHSLRTNLYDQTFIQTDENGTSENTSHVIKAGADWFVNDYNTFGISGGYSYRPENRYNDSYTDLLDVNRNLTGGYERIIRSPEKGETYDGSADFRKTFPGSKRELTANVNITMNYRNQDDKYHTLSYSSLFIPDQRIHTDGLNASYGGQVDYIHPTKNIRYETGIKITARDNDNDQLSERFDVDQNNWLKDASSTDRFNYRDEVYAAYVQAGGKLGVFEAQAGLRSEYAQIDGKSFTQDTTFSQDYLDFFPSASLRYSIVKGHDVQLSYSRRINRPGNQQLNPFTNFSDSLNISTGNPSLKPEYTQSLELGYAGSVKEQGYTVTLYYRYTTNNTQRFRTLDTSTGISVQTFLNYKFAQNAGLEIVLRNQIVKGVTLNTSFNAFRNWVDATNIDQDLSSDVYSFDVRSTLNARVLKNTSLQISGNYMAPREQPQGTFKGMSAVDVGIKQDFKGNHWSANLAVSDVFNTRKFVITSHGENFLYDFSRKRESRFVTLTLSYRFGSADTGFLQRKKMPAADQSQQQDMPDF